MGEFYKIKDGTLSFSKPQAVRKQVLLLSIEDSLYAYPFLFLLSFSHSNFLLLFLVEIRLFCLVYLLPPSLFYILLNLGFTYCWLLLLLLFFGRLAGLLTQSWEHFIDLLLVSCWFFFYSLDYILELFLFFHFLFLLSH